MARKVRFEVRVWVAGASLASWLEWVLAERIESGVAVVGSVAGDGGWVGALGQELRMWLERVPTEEKMGGVSAAGAPVGRGKVRGRRRGG